MCRHANQQLFVIALLATASHAQFGTPNYGPIVMGSPDPFQEDFNPWHPDFDIDNDGIPNSQDDDVDGDGVLDICDDEIGLCDATENWEPNPFWCVPCWWTPCVPDQEGSGLCPGPRPNCDADGDGIPNSTDTDDDNDGLLDQFDADNPDYDPTHPLNDPDMDGVDNWLDEDKDNDGCPDDMDPDPCDPDNSCEPPDDPNDPDDPPRPDDPPDPDFPDDPDTPDPPGPEDDPNEPDEPTPPDDPEPPDPEEDYPDDPPPTSDDCCIAITTRLDVVNMWLQHGVGHLEGINTNIYNQRLELRRYADDLMYNEDAFLRVMVSQGVRIEGYLEALYASNHNQEFYLEKLYEEIFNANQQDPAVPDNPEDYDFQPFDATTAYDLRSSHLVSMSEHDQEFALPDITSYDDPTPTEAPVWDWEIRLPMTNYVMNLNVDFAPMAPIRTVVNLVLYTLATIHSISIIMAVLKK